MAALLARVVSALPAALTGGWLDALGAWSRLAVRFLAAHTGLPVLLVAAVLLAVSYRVLRRSLRFAMEVAVLGAALLVASELGWIRW